MPSNYRSYLRKISPPVLRTLPGRMFVGIKALMLDFVAGAATHAVRAGWVGDTVGPAYDGLGAVGAETMLQKYPGETWTSFHTRLRNVWRDWPVAGHESSLIAHLDALGFPGAVIQYHTSWEGYPAPWWSLFSVFYAYGTHTAGPPKLIGGFTVGDGTIIGVTGITPIQMITLKSIVRKFKPAHWVCVAIVFEMSPGGARVNLGVD